MRVRLRAGADGHGPDFGRDRASALDRAAGGHILVMHKGVLREMAPTRSCWRNAASMEAYQLQYKDQEMQICASIRRLLDASLCRRHQTKMRERERGENRRSFSRGEASGEHYGALLMAEISPPGASEADSLAWGHAHGGLPDCAGWCAPKMSP